MKQTVQIDGAGRVVLPKPLRERFRLHGGDRLSLEVRGGAIELRPTSQQPSLKRVNGVLVYSTGQNLPSHRDLIDESREDRIAELLHRDFAG